MRQKRQQTVLHRWPSGQDWIPCQGGLVPYRDGEPIPDEGLPLDEYEPPEGAQWLVIPWGAQPADHYEIWRCTVDGRVSAVEEYDTRSEALAAAEVYNAGPDGPVVGTRYARYLVVAR